MQQNINYNPESLGEAQRQNSEQQVQSREQIPDILKNKLSEQQWASLTYDQREILANINDLPNQLTGVVPESVWKTLSFDQKLEFLYTHGVLPKDSISINSNRFEGSNFDGGMGESQPEVWDEESTEQPSHEAEQPVSGKIEVQEGAELKNQFEEAVNRVEQIESAHNQELKNIPDTEPEDSGTTDINQANTNKSEGHIPDIKFSGYAPDQEILANPDNYSDGPANLGHTWIANLYIKLRNALSQPS